MPSVDPHAESQPSLVEAAERLRASARWLVASFGAIAAVAFAGVSFSSLGSLTFATANYRLTVALAGVAVGIGGILCALAMAMRLSSASTTTITDLSQPDGDVALGRALRVTSDDPALSLWNGDVERFLNEYRDTYRQFLDQALAFAKDPHPQPDRSDLDKADFQLRVLTNVLTRTLELVSFLRLQYAFERSIRPIVLALLAASAGAAAFAWATSG